MMKFWKLAIALVGSLALTSPAHALLVDGFGDDQPLIADEISDGTSGTSMTIDPVGSVDFDGVSDGPMSITDTDLTNAARTISVNKLDGTGAVSSKVVDGAYFYSQDSSVIGEGQIDWTFSSQDFSGVNIIVTILKADQPGGTMDFTLGSDTVSMALPCVNNSFPGTCESEPFSQTYSLSDFSDTTGITSASLFIDGSGVDDLDLRIDFIEVPAPSILGLLGIGLMGVGFFARRRRVSA